MATTEFVKTALSNAPSGGGLSEEDTKFIAKLFGVIFALMGYTNINPDDPYSVLSVVPSLMQKVQDGVRIATFNKDGHLVFPNETEMWVDKGGV